MGAFGLYVITQSSGNSSDNFVASTADINPNNNTQNTSNPIVVVPSPVVNKKQPTSTPKPISPPKKNGIYNDGGYVGSVADAYYGNLQVKAIISGGRLTDVQILDYPQDRNTSIRINARALPILKQEAIAAQSANINAVSGASATSPAFIESLTYALNQAKA